MAKHPTPADLWQQIEEIAAEVESRIPADDVLARVNHGVQVCRLSSAFWILFGSQR